ncbi:RING finger domain-containing protein [Streptomyces sp. NPDC055085]
MECSICQDAVQPGEPAVQIKCRHVFHWNGCFQLWYAQHDTCPNCRKKIRNEDLTRPSTKIP